MARPVQNHPEFEHHRTQIQAAKTALKDKRREFYADEPRRWAKFSLSAQATLAAAMQAFYDAGANVTTIGKAYGTTDRATIVRMLDMSEPAPAATPVPPADLEPYTVTNTDPKAYTVRDNSTGLSLVWDVQVEPYRIVSAAKEAQGLKVEVKADSEHPMRAVLP